LPEFIIIYVLPLCATLLRFLLPPLQYFVSSGGRCCRRDVDAVAEGDLLFVAVVDDLGVIEFVLFDLARRWG
jgi:hypothetical protein